MAECFSPHGQPGGLTKACGLKGILQDATAAYLAELDRHTLADLLPEPAPKQVPVTFHRTTLAA
jgi:Rrf2 family nitric oxide-sensitive transcriptional repressor